MNEHSLHYKLLYRWVGRRNEMGDPEVDRERPEQLKTFRFRPLSHSQRNWYFDRIQEVLDPAKGMLATRPIETLGGRNSGLSVELPCLSLTQISLTNAEAHCRRYGRLGFGFTKRAILNLGGRPLAYIPGGVTDPTVKRLLKLRAWLAKQQAPPGLLRDFDYLRHYYKRIQFPCPQRDLANPPSAKEQAVKAAPKPVDPLKQMSYTKHRPLPYAEEQEWRIVLPNPEKYAAHAKIEHARWFPVVAGNELQVLVVPDNVIFQRVLADRTLMSVMAAKHSKPVQIISFESIQRL